MALIGISAGLGLPLPVSAGFIISGAYFGDKMSPLSDTTNLAPAVSGSELFDHIRAMMWTTLPTLLIVVVISLFMGSAVREMDNSRVELIQGMMRAEFRISAWGIVPPAVILVMALLKIPAIPGIVGGLCAGLLLSLFQGASLHEALKVFFYGYEPSQLSAFAAAATPEAVRAAAAETETLFASVPDPVIHTGCGLQLKSICITITPLKRLSTEQLPRISVSSFGT